MAQVYACIYYTYGFLSLIGAFVYISLNGIPYGFIEYLAEGIRQFVYDTAHLFYYIYLAFTEG